MSCHKYTTYIIQRAVIQVAPFLKHTSTIVVQEFGYLAVVEYLNGVGIGDDSVCNFHDITKGKFFQYCPFG